MDPGYDPLKDLHWEFFQALASVAYQGDVDRIREAHSEWRAHNPCEYPPLCTERGWAAPEVGEAFKNLWLALEDGTIRAWSRMGKDGQYRAIERREWCRARTIAMMQTGPSPGQHTPKPGYLAIPVRPLSLGDLIDPHIPERDFFAVLVAAETFWRNVVVSRSDGPRGFSCQDPRRAAGTRAPHRQSPTSRTLSPHFEGNVSRGPVAYLRRGGQEKVSKPSRRRPGLQKRSRARVPASWMDQDTNLQLVSFRSFTSVYFRLLPSTSVWTEIGLF